MKAITVKLPWALAIAAGHKTVENRSRPTGYRGPIAIHCSATWSRDGARDLRIRQWWLGRDAAAGTPELDATDIAAPFAFRHIIAVANLVDCHEARAAGADLATCCQPWGDPDYRDTPAWHLVLANVRRLTNPVSAIGKVMVPWQLPADVAAAVEQELARC